MTSRADALLQHTEHPKLSVGLASVVGMTAPRTYQDDDYWPEFGTLLICDTRTAYEQSGPFSRHQTKVQPCGTVVRTGNG